MYYLYIIYICNIYIYIYYQIILQMPMRRKRMRKTLRTGMRAMVSAEMIFLSDLICIILYNIV